MRKISAVFVSQENRFTIKGKIKKTMVIKCQNSDVVALFQDF